MMVKLGCMALQVQELEEKGEEIPIEVQMMLDEFQEVFNWPNEQPFWREKSHEINLKLGIALIKM